MPSTLSNLRSKVEQPDHLNGKVILYIGKEDKVVPYEKVRSFTFERLTNGIGNFSITLVDDNWVDIEQALLESKGEVAFQYGYENNLSPRYKGLIIGMELDPYLNYVVLNLTGLAQGVEFLTSSKFISAALSNEKTTDVVQATLYQKSFNIKNRSVSDFVSDLAELYGYKKDKDPKKNQQIIDPTASIPIKDSMFNTEDGQKILTSKGINLFTFLVRKLLPLAIDPDEAKKIEQQKQQQMDAKSIEPITKAVPFVFYTSIENNLEVFHFHKQDKFKDAEPVAIFDLFSDPDTRVISYKPSYEHMISNLTRGTSVYAWTYSPLSGTEVEEKALFDLSPSAVNPMYSYKPDNDMYVARKIMPYTPDPVMTRVEVARALQLAMNAPITADMVIIGDSSYNLCENIDVNVNIPHGTHAGKPHNTSNRYIILGITDVVDMGVFTTQLRLGTAAGATPKAKYASAVINENDKSKAQASEQNDRETLVEKAFGALL